MKRSTIVSYRADRPPEDAYPRQIVSPPAGGLCCHLHRRTIGRVRREGGWRFVYMRCQVCGYTVRRILERIGPWPPRQTATRHLRSRRRSAAGARQQIG